METLSARTALLNDVGVPRPLPDEGFGTETIGGDVHELKPLGGAISAEAVLLFAAVATTADGMPPKKLLVPSRGAHNGDGPKTAAPDCPGFVSAEERRLTR